MLNRDPQVGDTVCYITGRFLIIYGKLLSLPKEGSVWAMVRWQTGIEFVVDYRKLFVREDSNEK